MNEKSRERTAEGGGLEARNHNIQDDPSNLSERSDQKERTFDLKDPEATRDAELSQRYERMNFFQKYLMEIIFMFFMFAGMITMIPQTQIFLEKACEIDLQFNDTICDNINNKTYRDYNAAAARITKRIGLLKDIVTTLPGTVSSVIAGQYMNRYGVKMPLLLALLGSVATSSGDMYTFLKKSTPLYVNVLTAIPSALTGGFVVFMTAVFTNVTVTCPSEERKKRFLMIQFFMFLPIFSAVSLGGYLYDHYGAWGLAGVVYAGYSIPLFILLFIYEDTGVSEDAKKESAREAWDYSTSVASFKKSWSYLTRSRPGHAKTQILCMFCCLMTGVVAFTGTSDLDQLYVTSTFEWTDGTYGLIKAIVMAITFICAIPSMLILTTVFKFSDPMLVAIGFGSFAIKSSLMSVLFLGYSLFIIPSIVGLPFLVGLTAVRSHLSRLLEPHEVAVIFSLTSACERLSPVIADIAITAIYSATNSFFPGLVYLVQGALFLIPMGIALLCYRWTKLEGYPEYKKMDEDTDPEEET